MTSPLDVSALVSPPSRSTTPRAGVQAGRIVGRHNFVRDCLLRWIAHAARCISEPTLHPLQPLDEFRHRTANTAPDARSDILVEGLVAPFHHLLVDVAIFNRHEASYEHRDIPAVFRDLEMRKGRGYRERAAVVEHASFVPFIASSLGALGPAAQHFMKLVARHVAGKTGETYSNTIMLMRSDLNFTILRAALACLRGPRSTPFKADIWAMTPAYVRALARFDPA